MIPFLRDLIVKDFGLKLFSLVLAVLIYCTINFVAIKQDTPTFSGWGMPGEVRTFENIPVLIVSSAADVRHPKVLPETVTVTLQGDAKVLAGLGSDEIRALVNLAGIESASDLRKRIEVSTPAGVTRVRVVPAEVRVVFPSKG